MTIHTAKGTPLDPALVATADFMFGRLAEHVGNHGPDNALADAYEMYLHTILMTVTDGDEPLAQALRECFLDAGQVDDAIALMSRDEIISIYGK